MNNFTTSLTRNFRKLGALTLFSMGTLLVQSCSKNEVQQQEVAFLNITNTSPTTGTFNIYVDQTKTNTQGAVDFGGTLGYMRLTPGNHSVKFTTASSTESLITKNVTLEANTANSLFLIDRGTNLDFLTIKDELGNVTSTKAFIRFINLSPGAPAFNLAVKDGNVIVSDKAYKASSAFIEVEAKSYVLEIKDKATSETKVTLESFEFKAGKSYTVIATGLLEPSDAERSLGSKIITNQ